MCYYIQNGAEGAGQEADLSAPHCIRCQTLSWGNEIFFAPWPVKQFYYTSTGSDHANDVAPFQNQFYSFKLTQYVPVRIMEIIPCTLLCEFLMQDPQTLAFPHESV